MPQRKDLLSPNPLKSGLYNLALSASAMSNLNANVTTPKERVANSKIFPSSSTVASLVTDVRESNVIIPNVNSHQIGSLLKGVSEKPVLEEVSKTLNSNLDGSGHKEKSVKIWNKDDESETATVASDDVQSNAKVSRATRMERKRKREMERRSNVNKELENLTRLVMKINPPELKRRKKVIVKNKNSKTGIKDIINEEENYQLSRVDLIHLSTVLLERLHNESIQNASIIEKLLREKANTDNMAMLSMTSPSEGDSLKLNSAAGLGLTGNNKIQQQLLTERSLSPLSFLRGSASFHSTMGQSSMLHNELLLRQRQQLFRSIALNQQQHVQNVTLPPGISPYNSDDVINLINK